jgi:hypothetical protein
MYMMIASLCVTMQAGVVVRDCNYCGMLLTWWASESDDAQTFRLLILSCAVQMHSRIATNNVLYLVVQLTCSLSS